MSGGDFEVEEPAARWTGSTVVERDSIAGVGELWEYLFVSVCFAELTFSLKEKKGNISY
jgi:hypothetical protein